MNLFYDKNKIKINLKLIKLDKQTVLKKILKTITDNWPNFLRYLLFMSIEQLFDKNLETIYTVWMVIMEAIKKILNSYTFYI